jgi:hypothetical protein
MVLGDDLDIAGVPFPPGFPFHTLGDFLSGFIQLLAGINNRYLNAPFN